MNEITPRSKTKVLVDGGDPEETVRVKNLVGYVDGQATNPSLIAKTQKFGRWFRPAENSVPNSRWRPNR